MNRSKSVVTFTLTTTSLLFAGSVCAYLFRPGILKNINIIADVVHVPAAKSGNNVTVVKNSSSTKAPPGADLQPLAFERYTMPDTIIDFRRETALPQFMQKLVQVKKKERKLVRIAWLGDSIIEGDLLTQTFRRQMQQFFGGYGAGFVPVQSVVAQNRTTVKHSWTGDWTEETFKDKTVSAPLYLSGHTYYTENGSVTLKDATGKDSTGVLKKYLLCGRAANKISVTVNGQEKQYEPGDVLNRLLIDSSAAASVTVQVHNRELPVYGVSLEPAAGVVVDNFSFRGITGVELAKLDAAMLQRLSGNDGYDLVVLEYGANLMFRPNDNDYSWYEQHMRTTLEKLRREMPNTEFLVISTADRAFRYGEEWQSAVGIDSLLLTQARLARDNGAAFYNMYASMGGPNTIVSWANATPSLANKDYIHPNQRGAEVLGNLVFQAFLKSYLKASTPDSSIQQQQNTSAVQL
jgi:lysophospholipase L1-like esterase